ncbi:MAG: helix-turn-helix domain-containing protein [Candidatus Omnitrophica bacterium]|jgi:excisionase family DNA binding protein|nr:helix-turn-helix domain-containing protein [Candidatus Omnitrophota bacterium]
MKRQRIPRLMSVDELAEYLGLQKQTIYNWLTKKKISGLKIGKVWRFDRKYIDEWLKKFSKVNNG